MPDLRYIPRKDWAGLPIQPPAGLWYWRMRPIVLSVLVTVGVIVAMGFPLLRFRALVWLIFIPGTALGIEVVAGILMSILVAKPYRNERRLGYTTWPQATTQSGQVDR